MYKLLMLQNQRIWTELEHLVEKWACYCESFKFIEMANLYIHILTDESSEKYVGVS